MRALLLIGVILFLSGCIIIPYPDVKKVPRKLEITAVSADDERIAVVTNHGVYVADRREVLPNKEPFRSPNGVAYQNAHVLRPADRKTKAPLRDAVAYYFPYKDIWEMNDAYLDTSAVDPKTASYTAYMRPTGEVKKKQAIVFPPSRSASYLTPVLGFHPYKRNGGESFIFYDKNRPDEFSILVIPASELTRLGIGVGITGIGLPDLSGLH